MKRTAVVLSLLFALSTLALSGELVKVRAAYHPNWGPMTIPGIEYKMGFFKEEGLDVEWLRFTSGAPEIAAMASGDLSFGYIGHGALALCAEGKAEVLSLSHFTNSEAILVRKSSGLTTMADLKGKVVATEFGTSGEVILDMALKRHGIQRSEIEPINMPITSAISAFIGGSVDAIVAWGSDITSIKKNVGEEVISIVETSDFIDTVPFLGTWICTTGFPEEQPDLTLRFMRALDKCYEYRYNNVDATIRESADFAKAVGIGVSYDDLLPERDQLVFFDNAKAREWLENGEMEQIFQRVVDYMIASGRIKSADIHKFVRFDLMKKALGM